MFGHVRGSFTDAHRDKKGWLEMADGGTIFMDEIGEMSLRMQAMMLRFLETGEIQRVGSHQGHSTVDVRVIAATHRQLLDRVDEKSFREDLYYRLNVMHLQVAPLRHRPDDIPVLLRHFLGEFGASHRVERPELTGDAQAALVSYPWPGNVRELRNIAERLVLRMPGGTVDVGDLPPEVLVANRESRRAAERVPSRPWRRCYSSGSSAVNRSGWWSAIRSSPAISPDPMSAIWCGPASNSPAATIAPSSNCSSCRPTTTSRSWRSCGSTSVTYRPARAMPGVPGPYQWVIW